MGPPIQPEIRSSSLVTPDDFSLSPLPRGCSFPRRHVRHFSAPALSLSFSFSFSFSFSLSVFLFLSCFLFFSFVCLSSSFHLCCLPLPPPCPLLSIRIILCGRSLFASRPLHSLSLPLPHPSLLLACSHPKELVFRGADQLSSLSLARSLYPFSLSFIICSSILHTPVGAVEQRSNAVRMSRCECIQRVESSSAACFELPADLAN